MDRLITLLPGDGIGPEITDAVMQILAAAGVELRFEEMTAGVDAVEKGGTPMPQITLDSIRANGIALKGPLTTPVGTGFRSVNVALRQEFDLYANVRPLRSILPTGRYPNVDLVIVRENTEGLYCGIEHWIASGDDPKHAAESVMLVTRRGAERIIRYAFEYAVRHNRPSVTLAHKANILKYSQGLMLEIGRQVAEEYKDRVEFRDRIIDALCMDLVMDPARHSVIVSENLFGDILSDLGAGLVGGLGLAPGANMGTDTAIFEAVHGSAPDIAGKGVANPSSLLLSACMMLDHLGLDRQAEAIRTALLEVLREGRTLTRDLGGTASTETFSRTLAQRIR